MEFALVDGTWGLTGALPTPPVRQPCLVQACPSSYVPQSRLSFLKAMIRYPPSSLAEAGAPRGPTRPPLQSSSSSPGGPAAFYVADPSDQSPVRAALFSFPANVREGPRGYTHCALLAVSSPLEQRRPPFSLLVSSVERTFSQWLSQWLVDALPV